MTPEGGTHRYRRRLSHPAAAAAETGVRPFKRSVVIHSSYCSAPITAPAVLNVLGDEGGSMAVGLVRWSFSSLIGHRFTERARACVREVNCAASVGTVIAGRHPVSPHVVHVSPGRFVPLVRPPRLDIYCHFIVDCAERTSSFVYRSALIGRQAVLLLLSPLLAVVLS